MKKTIAILIALLFIVSLVPVFADASIPLGNSDISVKAGGRQQIKLDRESGKETNAKLREGINVAREIFKESKEKLESDRKVFSSFKDQLKLCRGKETDECNSVKMQASVKAIILLKTTATTMLDLENQVLTTLQAAPEFEGKAEALTKIQVDINTLTQLKIQIDSLGENPDKAQLKTLAKNLREFWQDSKHNLKFGAGVVLSERISGILVQSERLEIKLNSTLERLKAKGLNTTKADAKVIEFNQDIADAKVELEAARIQLLEARFATNITLRHEAVISAHTHLRTAHQKLNNARDALKEAVREIKGIKGGERELELETKAESETTVNTTTESEDTDPQTTTTTTTINPEDSNTAVDVGVQTNVAV